MDRSRADRRPGISSNRMRPWWRHVCWRHWPRRFLPAIRHDGRRLGSRTTSMAARPMTKDAKQRSPMLLFAWNSLSARRSVLLSGSITTGGVIALSPGLGGSEFVGWWRGMGCGKGQGSSLPSGRRGGHACRGRSRRQRQFVSNRLRCQQSLPELDQSVHRFVPLRVRHVDQVPEIRDGIVESGIAQFLEQAAL